MYQAQKLTPLMISPLYTIVQQLAQKANLPMPKVYLINDPLPNAFATVAIHSMPVWPPQRDYYSG